MNNDLLIYLAVGLLAYEKQGYGYPYPPPLQQGLNRLAGHYLEQGKELPGTLTAVRQLFHRPLNQWLPEGALPAGIEGDYPLLYDDRVDEQIVEYLAGLPVTAATAVSQLEAILDNQLVQNLLEGLRELYHQQPERAQQAYEKVRRFLIKHPYTSNAMLIRHLGTIREVDLTLIQKMYEPAVGNPLFMHEGQYWLCPHCGGLLRWRDGRAHCAKPGVCGRLYPDYAGKQLLRPEPDLMALKWSIHARTCIPGLCEITLFDTLNTEPYHNHVAVTLWPGVDRYDLQLRFDDGEAWAVDVKDYKNPQQLGHKIAADTLYDAEPALRWQRGFYVVPAYRTDQLATDNQYLARVKNAAGKLPANITILGEWEFLAAVQLRIKQR